MANNENTKLVVKLGLPYLKKLGAFLLRKWRERRAKKAGE